MSHEITFAFGLNKTLWAAAFKNDSGTYKVNVTGSDVWEAWQDGNVATYDVSLTERGGGGIYTATWPSSGSIAAGVYFMIVYEGAVAATDPPVGEAEFYWDGTAEINLDTLSDQMDAISAEDSKVQNVYGPGE